VPIVRIPNVLSGQVGGRVCLELPGATVADVLDAFAAEAPELARAVAGGGIRVFVGERAAAPETALSPDDELFLVPSLAGG